MYVKQAANTLEILEYFARRLRPATPAEIADDLGWPRSSTFNLVGTLATKGYLYEPRVRGGYYPSARWLALAEMVSRAELLPVSLERLVLDLARETGETVLIATPTGTSAIFVQVEGSRQPVRYFVQPGERVPIHASSAGRALLAQMAPEARATLYRRIDFQAYSATSPMTSEAVEAELAAAGARGYHQSNAEYTPDLAGVSLPLPGYDRALSIVVVGPASRCLDRRAETAVLMRKYVAALSEL
ncbi:MAG: IclR family transcriptional regulator [Sphingomonadales bacterium]|nr:IclR family transcriptional regulator [Sphingomonadales bacterium]